VNSASCDSLKSERRFFSEILTGNIPIGTVIPAGQNKIGRIGGTNLIHQREGNEIIFGGLNAIHPRPGETDCHGFFDGESLLQKVHLHYGVHCWNPASS
jgi:hypothetical protein